MKHRITLLLTAVLLLTGLTLRGQMRTEASIDFSEQGYGNAQDLDSVVINIDDNVTVVFNQAEGSNSPKYFNTGSAIRAYGGNNFVVSSTGDITSITLTFGPGDGSNELTTEVGTFDSPTWSGSSSEVTFTVGGTSGHRRIKAIDVIYSMGGTPQETVATPTFDPDAGTYYEAQTVTINCATEEAIIYYTLDGSIPTESSPEYISPINIVETTTVKAIAMKESYNNSSVATATYIIAEAPSVITIAEARALNDDEYALVQGVVTFIDGRNVYIQDETAAIDLYLNSNAPSTLTLGDMVQAYGKKTVYKGLTELSNIDPSDEAQFAILSSGNALPLAVKTIAEILNGSDANGNLQASRVKVEGATIGAINTNGNTSLTQDEATINIYKIPALTGIEEGDVVDVICIIGYYNVPQLRVAWASDVVLSEIPTQPAHLTVSVSELNGFDYVYESGPSEVQHFEVGGENLTHNVTIMPSENFEISTLPNELFQPENPALIYISETGFLSGIKIYVRLKAGLEVGTYTEQIAVSSEDANTIYVSVTGIVTGEGPTPPPTPTGDYVRISDLSSLTEGCLVVFAARFDENATDYYAMSNASSGKPTGVLFTSTDSDNYEILPASIVDEESNYYWTVGVTSNGYTFTNALGEMIGYSSSTNFATGGDNTEWSIEAGIAGDIAMVPNYSGFLVTNVNNDVRHFALNSNHNFGPYHTNNLNNNGYSFYLDLFVKTEGINPPTPTVATPTFTPAAGTYYEAQTVSIACATEGATIHYTLDGSEPTEDSPVYTTPLNIETTTTVKAFAMKEGFNNSNVASATYTIQLGVVTIFYQDWEGEMNGWTFVDVDGNASWTIASYQGNHYAYANGYNQGANIDWCISPAFNLNSIGNPVLSFRTAKNYNGPDMEVYFSNDYDGIDPTTATWQLIECELSAGSWAWIESGEISLSGFSGTNCYIGFKYTSEEGSAAGWEVDDIMLVGQTSEPVLTVSPLTLNGFNYIVGNGPSAEQSFTITGLNLSNGISISETSHFEISTASGDDFNAQSTITLTPISGNVEETTIYVRMKAGLAVGSYNDEDLVIASTGLDDIAVTCSGTVNPEPVPGDDYVRISDVSELVDGNRIVFAARFDENAADYYAMSNAASGKPTGVLFTSATSGNNEILPASIINEENNFYWTVGVTADGYTFTNANGDMIGYTSSTNFAPNGDNTVWSIEIGTSEETAMVPNYTGFVITNVNNAVRAFALNNNHNFGPYHTQNMAGENYNFFLDIFMQGESGTPTVATPTFTPAAGTYYEAQTVSIACATEGATIHYTLDGTDPTEDSPVYTAPLNIETTTTVKAFAMKEGFNNSNIASATYTIQLGVVTIFNQDWEGEMNGWTFVTVEGDKPWNVSQYQGNHYAYANGYNGGANEQWCISPAFNINDYQDVTLTFRNAKNYNGPDLELKYSTNYDGVNPATADWWTFEFNMSPGSFTWVESGNIPISIYPAYSTNCYIAFKYTSTETEAAAWEVDDIILTGSTSVSNISVTPSSLSGFTHVVGEGPSASQYFTLSGVNIGPAPGGGSTGSVIIQSTENEFEVSLDDEVFSWQVYIDGINGTLPPTPIYVRMNGAEVGQYTATVEIHASSSDEATVALSGTVTAPPVPGDDYVRISDAGQLMAGNRVILAARYNETANAYVAIQSTLTGGKLATTEFNSVMNGTDEIIPAEILSIEGDYYWTVGITDDGYTFTNASGEVIGYNSSTNFNMNGEKTDWTITTGTSDEGAMVPNYYGFNIINVITDNRAFALNANHVCGAYHTQNLTSADYNFFLDIFMQGEGGVPPTPTVATPTFDPVGGTYYEAQTVTINCTTADATIYYSLVSEPYDWDVYEGAITVDEDMTIWAYATKEGYNDSPIVSADYIIQDDIVIIFNQDWEDGWNGWTEYCESGDSLWHIGSYGGNHYAYANGYNHPATVDWLISPAFDLDSYSNVVLTFNTARNYNGPDIEVYFSNDYDGQDPTLATWQPLECELSQGSWNWVASGEISLDGFSGSNCYIGFKYISDENAAGWEVDDIKLASGSATPMPTLIATPNYLGDFSYVVGHGPSESQSYVLSGVNLEDEGEITIVSCSWYEISLDNETFTGVLDFPCTDLPATIYVRMMEGLEPNTYDGVYIANEYTDDNNSYAAVVVNLSGVVHYENEPMMSTLMPLYIQGNNGSNNNRVPVAVLTQFANLYPNTTYHYTNQFVDGNDGPETAGAGNVIYVNPDGFYRSTSPSLATPGGYGEFTTDDEGYALVWLMNEPTANTRFTPGNHVFMRVRLNDGAYGVNVLYIFTSEDYATVLNFGTENDENSGSAFYVKSNDAPMSFAMLFNDTESERPVYSTSIETIGVDYAGINQYADFYKELVAGNDGWFGGILPNVNDKGITYIVTSSLDSQTVNEYMSENGQWHPEANTVNPTNGLDEPIFIDLTYDGVEESDEANVKVWNADHEFVIENGDNTHYSMTVYNVLGQPMMMKQINAGSTERISHSLASGVYVISLQNNQNTVSVKVIVR